MISILIPVFNRDVNELVHSLSGQAGLLNTEFEIVVMDDGSETIYKNLNRKLTDIPFVRYIDSVRNNGRIVIRQMLACAASYGWLLFLDCDSKIVSGQFLQKYLSMLSTPVSVVTGGRIYIAAKPTDCSLALHWKYGSQREVLQFHKKHVNRLMTNNFLIRKEVFQALDFSSGWKGYGYEDNWMAIQLDEIRTPVQFIDNPVLHDGLESSDVFLVKSLEALQNLRLLAEHIPGNTLRKHIKLYDYYCRFKAMKLLWMLRWTGIFFRRTMLKNMQSCDPSLTVFDLYRLGMFCELTGS